MTGDTLRQSTAVAIGGRALLIEGPPRCGKSTLALSLIDRGAQLIGDDGISLSKTSGQLIASAAPKTAGLIEIHNIGIVKRQHSSAPVSLILTISADAPRIVDAADELGIAGHAIPHIQFARCNDADPIRAEIALNEYGLPLME